MLISDVGAVKADLQQILKVFIPEISFGNNRNLKFVFAMKLVS